MTPNCGYLSFNSFAILHKIEARSSPIRTLSPLNFLLFLDNAS